jgi:tetraacyldisaccharide 4'-kinase
MRARLERWLTAGWQRRGWVYWLFYDLSALFAWVARRRRARYLSAGQRTSLPCPVIVVGNVIAGGAGKTPVTIALVQALKTRARTPGVILRGHAGAAAQTGTPLPRHVPPDTDPATVGDEAVLIALRTGVPVVTCRDRVAAAHALLAAHPEVDVIVSDDGLQHYALPRQFECVLWDSRGAGNGRHLPAGPLREAADRPRNATLFVGCAVDEKLARMADAPAFEVAIRAVGVRALGKAFDAASDDAGEAVATAGSLAGQHVSAYAGMANPAKFFATLKGLGASVDAHPLPDHACMKSEVFSGARQPLIVITEKDAVKCRLDRTLAVDARLLVLRIEAGLPDELIDLILETLHGQQAA